MDAIRVENVSIVFGQKTILSNINWVMRRGEHWALLGPNGSGKSTMLHLILGQVRPYANQGTVEVLGKRHGACDLFELRRAIGWVSSSLHERLDRRFTGMDIVLSGKFGTIGLWQYQLNDVTDEDRQRALEVMKQFHCADLVDRPYGTMSPGEQQRVRLARAMVARPQLLLLDEPCVGLDFVAREQFLQAVSQMLSRPDGPTVLYVTHYAEEILPGLSHVLLLSQGRIAATGTRSEVLVDDVMSAAFGMPLTVSWHDGRPVVGARM